VSPATTLLTFALFILASACAVPIEDGAYGSSSLEVNLPMTAHFDIGAINHCGGRAVCDPSEPQCLCPADLRHANYVRVLPDGRRQGHYVAQATERFKTDIRAQGNVPALYVDRMNDDWESGGRAVADRMISDARASYGGNAPRWFLLNEISRSRWLDRSSIGTRYRRYVAELAQRLHVQYERKVLIFSPFERPPASDGHRAEDWSAVAMHAFIGVEAYLGGQEIATAGYSEAWCRGRYAQALEAYRALGVDPRRQILTEHFAHSEAGLGRGREGLSEANWLRAIRIRTRAATSLPFYGFASYAWGFNQMSAPARQRFAAQDVYHLELGEGHIALAEPGLGSFGSDPAVVASEDPMPGVETGGGGDPRTSTDPGADDRATDPVPSSEPSAGGALMCGGLHQSCTAGAGECCDGFSCSPGNSTCRRTIGESCETGYECVTGRACAGTPRVCCVIVGDACGHDYQCCNGHSCNRGRCCVRRGGGCARDDQCCSGVCGRGGCA